METSKIIKIFIAYSRKDTDFLNDLRIFLWPLENNQSIKIWYDGEIIPGQVWENEIKQALHTAEIFLLLVSANSLASDYFYNKEVSNALERHHKGESIVIPVILKPSGWRETDLASLQALPQNGKPVTLWNSKDEAYESIYEGLKSAIKRIQDKEYLKNKSEEEQKQLQMKIEEQKQKEQRLWQEAVKTNSIFSYTKYIDESVNGLHSDDARQLLKELEAKQKNEEAEQRLWERTRSEDTLNAFEEYLNEYPNGNYKQESLDAINKFEGIEKKNQGLRAQNERSLIVEQEDRSWKEAIRVNTVSSYRKYLSETKIGLFKEKAQHLINQLDTSGGEKGRKTQFWRNPKIYLYLLGGLIVIIALVFMLQNLNSGNNAQGIVNTSSDSNIAPNSDAEYPGGEQGWDEYLAKNMQFPKDVDPNIKSGSAVMKFDVDENGTISNIQPVYFLNTPFITEATRLLRSGAKWNPAKKNGEDIKSTRELTFVFVRH